jgi:hypothetical protein
MSKHIHIHVGGKTKDADKEVFNPSDFRKFIAEPKSHIVEASTSLAFSSLDDEVDAARSKAKKLIDQAKAIMEEIGQKYMSRK